jgi:hypothetical protein
MNDTPAMHTWLSRSTLIPQSSKYFSTRMEDGLVIADAELRRKPKESAPDCFERCQKRRSFMSTVLGLELPEEVLPLSNTCAIVPPLFLSPNTVIPLEAWQISIPPIPESERSKAQLLHEVPG